MAADKLDLLEENYLLRKWMQDPTIPADNPPGMVTHNGVTAQAIRGTSRPRLVLMGQRRSGKSSISNVIFHKMPPSETLFLESTTKIHKDFIHTFMDFTLTELPGQLDYTNGDFDLEVLFGDGGALVYVIDSQDEYQDALIRLHETIITIANINPHIHIEVLIHKVDGLSDDFKLDTQRDIMQRTQDELSDTGLENLQVNYHLTSIYDHSIFEAFSKVMQKLIPALPTLENLINALCANCRIEKAFLFDVMSKCYIATDSSPVDVQSYEICSDFIDVVLDMSEIYGYERVHPESEGMTSNVVTRKDDDALHDATSVMKLANGTVLYLKEMDKHLALICIMRKESFEKRGLVDYNIGLFQNALKQVFAIQQR